MGWPRPGSSAYPVLSLQCLLTAALDTRLAPDCSRAGQGRGPPVLCGQLWSWLFPLGVLKQTLPALHLQPAPACLHLWALEGAQRTQEPLWQMEAVSGPRGSPLPLTRQCWGSLRPVRLNAGLQWVTWGPGCCHFSSHGLSGLEQPQLPTSHRDNTSPGPTLAPLQAGALRLSTALSQDPGGPCTDGAEGRLRKTTTGEMEGTPASLSPHLQAPDHTPRPKRA